MNVADRAFSFILFIIIARISYETVYGQIVTMFTLSSVCAVIFDMGLAVFLQREIAAGFDKSIVFSKVFSLGILFYIPFFTLAILLYKLLYADIPFYFLGISSLIIYLSSLVNIINKALSGLRVYKSQFIAFFLPRFIISLLILFSFYCSGAIADNMLMLFFFAVVLNLIMLWIYAFESDIRFRFSLKNIIPVIRSAFPLGLAVIFNYMYDKIDVLVISSYRGFDETAFYSAGYGIFKTASITFSFLMVSGFTEVSSMKNNHPKVRNFYTRSSVLVLIICVPTTLLLYFLADSLINFLYTTRFNESAGVLKILSIAVPAVGLNNLTGITINGLGYFKLVMYVTLVGLLLNFSLNLFFVPVYGIVAAALITVFTEFFIFAGEYFFLKKILSTEN